MFHKQNARQPWAAVLLALLLALACRAGRPSGGSWRLWMPSIPQ